MAEIRPLSNDTQQQLQDLEATACTLLSLTADTPPAAVVAAITEHVRRCKDDGTPVDESDVFALGALLGAQYVRGHGWQWGDVVWDFDESTAAIGVLNPDDSLFNNPIGWVGQTVDAPGAVTFMLHYNLVAAHRTPVFDPGSATALY